MCIRDRRTVDRRCLRPEDVSDDEKLSRTIKIIVVSKFIKEIVRMAANLNITSVIQSAVDLSTRSMKCNVQR